jgi:DNA-binding response OmpR family regulator
MPHATILYLGQKNNYFDELQKILESQKVQTKQIDSLQSATDYLMSCTPHLLLALTPGQGVTGLTLCQELRQVYKGLLILVSNQKEVDFHSLALGLGADASIRYEHGTQLLAANVQAMLRRCETLHPVQKLSFGNLIIDSSKRDVFVAGESVALSTIEFQLIWSLARRQGSVVTREEIHQELYHSTYNGYDRSIDLYVSRIRQKIGDLPGAPKYLKTVRGIGYQFIPAEPTSPVPQTE